MCVAKSVPHAFGGTLMFEVPNRCQVGAGWTTGAGRCAVGRPIYLDYNATTPIAPEVFEAMVPFLQEQFGNPSSSHTYGAAAHEAVDRARSQVAGLIGCAPTEIVFTGAGSEANNLAIKGVAFARRDQGDHLITSAVEHPAVLATCQYLVDRFGYRLTVVPVDGHGLVDPGDVARAIEPKTV